MVDITEATADDIDALIRLQGALFVEDAGVHDPYADTSWPEREGRQDLEDLIGSPHGLVLTARDGTEPVGLLIGYSVKASPTRKRVRYAVLRTLYVARSWRRSGAATALTERFLHWGRQQGCVEAHVDHYSANEGAGRFYDGAGFTERSVSRSYPLT